MSYKSFFFTSLCHIDRSSVTKMSAITRHYGFWHSICILYGERKFNQSTNL